ncbi:GNAT family N-acetyltransferase [Magnetococcales bacterium HHB-1]
MNQKCVVTEWNRDRYQQLWMTCGPQSVFNEPGWIQSILDSENYMGTVSVIETYRDERLIGLWPVVVRHGEMKEAFAKLVEPLSTHLADYNLPLSSDSDRIEVIVASLHEMRRLAGFMGLVILKKLPLSEAEQHRLSCALKASFPLLKQNQRACPRLRFKATYEETEQAFGRSHRADVRRRVRRLKREGELTFWVSQRAEEILERLPLLFELHKEKWALDGIHSEFHHQEACRFFQKLSHEIPDKKCHYSEVRLDDQVIAAHFGFIEEGWLYWYKPVISNRYRRFSPGKAHLSLLSRDAIDRNLIGIDFLQGAEGYKTLWANDDKQNSDYIAAGWLGWPFWKWQNDWRPHIRQLYLKWRHA